MKKIENLIPDIERVFSEPHVFDEQNLKNFGERLAKLIAYKINQEHKPSLRMSNLGTKCERKLWYEINKPDAKQPLSFSTRVKFLFGHVLEELLLFLAAEAGHKVEGEQDKLTINGVDGHRDAIIDGVLVDCKSASSFSFKKFKSHLNHGNDDFGYITQLNAYLYASQDDPKLTEKEKAAFLVIDKQLGHIALDIHEKDDVNYDKVVDFKRHVIQQKTPPPRYYKDEEEGASGNRKLCMACSYCDFNKTCWPGYRTFLYKKGDSFKPVHLTVVKREPNVPELKAGETLDA